MTTFDAVKQAAQKRFGDETLTEAEVKFALALSEITDCPPDLQLWSEVLEDAADLLFEANGDETADDLPIIYWGLA
jgi:hypothetical protein